MNLQRAIPVLRMFNVEQSKNFYLDFLGFSLEWEHRFATDLPLYAQIRRDDVVLHLTEHYGDATPGSTVFLPVADIAALERELADKRHGYARPAATEVGWGWQMEVADPSGNRLRFCQLSD
ncbi:glyoxalase superfamily protein [Pseudomonas japonica]|uniref:glyoxalase superfamily protein n=1 Tax=Pseudomonas TaxID=286 RepID=UPI0029295763|nr:glyoxalase superfamily protein [Pseudomonas sp. zfem002]MDU9391986.1 glyoxalase superfamily protein [Pseudomonas sp. zfem002]